MRVKQEWRGEGFPFSSSREKVARRSAETGEWAARNEAVQDLIVPNRANPLAGFAIGHECVGFLLLA
ncbi:hypothetical protein QV13_16255 [Mesorhizobium hungaricum]|jgi:hypothetical protein|uniref:Uncharacterized protein n=1 Tax=Mesorhizobium hungaricum TaxID=1566387 RepID=A0A1C2DNM6_9HYPH|nr:hypothetical protein QV13_16255 [Mesorhizobium hungaricum]